MTVQSQRATVCAIKTETTSGTLVAPAAAGDFIPLKSGFALTPEIEELASEEIVNSLAASKTFTGKESPTGTHGIYLKHSETAGTAPEYAPLIKSALGEQSDAAAEYNTVAGSTTSVVNVDSAEGLTYQVGEALLLQDSVNSYSIRNIESISTDALTMNFNLSGAPAAGVELGQANLFYPATSGHPSFSYWLYSGNGGAIQAAAGCRTTAMAMDFSAGQQATLDFSFAGTQLYFNPMTVSATNKNLDITDDGGTVAVALTEGVYKDPIELASHVQTVVGAALLASGGDDFTCTYSSSTGKFTLATTTGSLLSILWKTGTSGADGADTSAAALLGFADAADDTGALTYTSDSEQSWAAGYTPSYDDADNIVVKSNELLIGDATDNTCRVASNVTFSIDTSVVDADSVCSATGLYEKVPSARTSTMTCSLIYQKHEVDLFNRMIQNRTTKVMMNIGPKSGGNWVPGKCVNIYMPNASITSHAIEGDDYLILNLTIKSFRSSTLDDVYINFI